MAEKSIRKSLIFVKNMKSLRFLKDEMRIQSNKITVETNLI